MLDVLSGFVAELRAAGIPVSLTEHLDAAEAMRHVPMEDREALKYTLGASLVKSSSHWHAYETAFEIYFSFRGPEYADRRERRRAGPTTDDGQDVGRQRGPGKRPGGGSGQEAMTPEELADLLYKALLGANDAMITAVARQAVARLCRHGGGATGGGDLLPLPHPAEPRPRRGDGAAGGPGPQGAASAPARATPRAADPSVTLTALEERLVRDEYQARIDQLRKEIENEIRRRSGGRPGQRGPGQVAAQAAARGHRLHARHPRRAGGVAQVAPAAVPQAGRAAGPQTAPRAQGPTRLPHHGPPLAFHRRGPGRAQVPLPATLQARDRGHRRHLRVGGQLRPLHPPPGPRHQLPVLQGAELRVHRRHRRGQPVLRGRRRPGRGGAPDQHRGRRHLGGRPLRLRARPHRVLGAVGRGDHPQVPACCSSATPATTTTPRRPG